MKLVAISDTHRQELDVILPEGDVLIHAGDYDVREFMGLVYLNEWFGELKHKFKHIIFIAGNHDFYLQKEDKDRIREIVSNAIYLEDDSVVIEGIKFYGYPWTPMFMNWAFMADIDKLKERTDWIDSDTNVLISHGPPFGLLDQLEPGGFHVGDPALRNKVKEVAPQVFICGHIHESYGRTTDYKTDYYNVTLLDEMYTMVHEPTIITMGE